MHELTMARDLFRSAEAHASGKGLQKITRIKIAVGEASGVEVDFLRHSFEDHLFPGSLAEGAELVLAVDKISLSCCQCKKRFAGEAGFSCPSCGSSELEINGGRDVYIDEVEGTF